MLVALDLDKELRVKVDVLDYSMGGILLCHILSRTELIEGGGEK